MFLSRAFFVLVLMYIQLQRKICVIGVILSLAGLAGAQGRFEYTAELQAVYQDILELKLEKAKTDLSALKASDPHNLSALHIENYIDFYTVFINEDKKEFKRLEKNRKKRIKYIEKHGDKSSPYYLFSQAEINLQWALARSKFGEQFNALRDLYSAYRDLKQNERRHPNFIENKKSLSVIHAVNETIPIPGLIKRIFTLEGDLQQGEREILELLEYTKKENSFFYAEALASHVIITLYQKNDKEAAYLALKNSKLDPSSSNLVNFLYAKVAQRAGYNDHAIQILSDRVQGEEYLPFPYLDFLMGLSKLRKLDPEADVPLKRFVNNFTGRLYLKEAYQKLAWFELVINENEQGYKKYIKRVNSVGTELVDDDKQAQKEYDEGVIPNIDILRARLLFDGGYIQRAYNYLIQNSEKYIYNSKLVLEYYYRLGRSTQELKNYPDALKYFRLTVENGRSSTKYFACNAALQMAIIYEEQKDYEKAKKYFEECLSMEPSKYKNSLHQKAKTGLDRIQS